jgi:chromosome segregation ATPase
MTDFRTYPVTPVTLDALSAENERLRNELDAMTAHWRNAESALADAKRELTAHRDERPRLLAANVRLFNENSELRAELATQTDNAAELGKALDMALAERGEAFAQVDALRAELDAMRQAHSFIAARMAAMGC